MEQHKGNESEYTDGCYSHYHIYVIHHDSRFSMTNSKWNTETMELYVRNWKGHLWQCVP